MALSRIAQCYLLIVSLQAIVATNVCVNKIPICPSYSDTKDSPLYTDLWESVQTSYYYPNQLYYGDSVSVTALYNYSHLLSSNPFVKPYVNGCVYELLCSHSYNSSDGIRSIECLIPNVYNLTRVQFVLFTYAFVCFEEMQVIPKGPPSSVAIKSISRTCNKVNITVNGEQLEDDTTLTYQILDGNGVIVNATKKTQDTSVLLLTDGTGVKVVVTPWNPAGSGTSTMGDIPLNQGEFFHVESVGYFAIQNHIHTTGSIQFNDSCSMVIVMISSNCSESYLSLITNAKDSTTSFKLPVYYGQENCSVNVSTALQQWTTVLGGYTRIVQDSQFQLNGTYATLCCTLLPGSLDTGCKVRLSSTDGGGYSDEHFLSRDSESTTDVCHTFDPLEDGSYDVHVTDSWSSGKYQVQPAHFTKSFVVDTGGGSGNDDHPVAPSIDRNSIIAIIVAVIGSLVITGLICAIIVLVRILIKEEQAKKKPISRPEMDSQFSISTGSLPSSVPGIFTQECFPHLTDPHQATAETSN